MAGICESCGRKFGLFARLGGRTVCPACERKRREEEQVRAQRVIVREGEMVHMKALARLMKHANVRGYRSSHSGLSYRVSKGVRYYEGGASGRSMIVGTQLMEDDVGLLTITSQRAIFVGSKRTVEMPYSKLRGLGVFVDGIEFHMSNRTNAPLFRVERGEAVAAALDAAFQRVPGTSHPLPSSGGSSSGAKTVAPPRPAPAGRTTLSRQRDPLEPSPSARLQHERVALWRELSGEERANVGSLIAELVSYGERWVANLGRGLEQDLEDSNYTSLSRKERARLSRWCNPNRWSSREQWVQPRVREISLLLFGTIISREAD